MRIAVMICPVFDNGFGPSLKVLGLTVGERLLLSLAKANLTHVAFVGAGERPSSPRNSLKEIAPSDIPADAGAVWIMPSDGVFDPALLKADAQLPEDGPIRRVDPASIRDVIDAPDRALSTLGAGRADSGKGFAIRVTDTRSKRAAENALMKSLVKAADGLISRYLNRKISTFISRRLAPFPITPNQVTVFVFLVGVISGPLAFLGTPLGFALGGFCYWFSAVLDGCDGEIARLKYQGSPLGAWLDTVVDDIACLSYIIGMYISLNRVASGPYWGWAGIVATVFFLLTVLPRYYIMAVRSGSGDFQKIAKETRTADTSIAAKILMAVKDFIFRTDFLPFAGMVTAVVGAPWVFAAPFAVGAVFSAIDSIVKLFTYRPPVHLK